MVLKVSHQANADSVKIKVIVFRLAMGAVFLLLPAGADFDQAIDLDPEDAAAYNNRGLAYANKGDLERAIADYDQAIALDPEDAYAYNNRGVAYFLIGNHDQALADLGKAIEIDSGFASAYYLRGLVHGEIGERERAISDLEKSIELGLDAGTKQAAEEILEDLGQ